jgi:hypothetical protein
MQSRWICDASISACLLLQGHSYRSGSSHASRSLHCRLVSFATQIDEVRRQRDSSVRGASWSSHLPCTLQVAYQRGRPRYRLYPRCGRLSTYTLDPASSTSGRYANNLDMSNPRYVEPRHSWEPSSEKLDVNVPVILARKSSSVMKQKLSSISDEPK